MKKIFAAVAIALFAMSAFNAQAQNSLYNETAVVEAQKATVVDPLIADFSTVSFEAPSQAQSLAFAADNGDESTDVPGRRMRFTGMIMTGAGFTVAAAFGGYAAYLANRDPEDVGGVIGDIFGTAISTEIAVGAAAVGVVGVVFWAVGGSRMKHFKASANGAGIAFNF